MNEILYDIKKKILGRIYSMGEWHESNWFDRPYCVSVIKEISNYKLSFSKFTFPTQIILIIT